MKVDQRAVSQAVAEAKKNLQELFDQKGTKKEAMAGRSISTSSIIIVGKKQYSVSLTLKITNFKRSK